MESGCAERLALWGSGWKYSLLEDIQGLSERKMISEKLVSLFFSIFVVVRSMESL